MEVLGVAIYKNNSRKPLERLVGEPPLDIGRKCGLKERYVWRMLPLS